MVEENLLSTSFARVPFQQPFLVILNWSLTIRCRLCNDLVYFALRFAHEVFLSKTIVVDNPLHRNGPVGEEAHGPGVASLDRFTFSLQGFSSSSDGGVVGDLLNSGPASQGR
jgi:hypothetical protein